MLKKIVIIPCLLIIGSLVIWWLAINPLRHQLPTLRQTININRGQLETLTQIANQKKQTSATEDKNHQSWELIKQTALPRGQELTLITSLENMAEKNNITQRLRLDESKAVPNNNWRQSEMFLELESSFANIIMYLKQLESLPYLITFKTIRLNQSGTNNVHVILGGQILWQ